MSIGAFGTSNIIVLKILGIGTALALLADSLLVRCLLLPAALSPSATAPGGCQLHSHGSIDESASTTTPHPNGMRFPSRWAPAERNQLEDRRCSSLCPGPPWGVTLLAITPPLVSSPARTSVLLERSGELAVIEGALADARAGTGRFVVIAGSAGIGKSAVLDAAGVHAAGLGVTALHARGAELERSFAYGVVRQLFESVVVQAGEADRQLLLRGAAASSARLFLDGERTALVSSENDVYALLHGLYWLTVNLAEARPLLLAIDDLHWGDPASLRWLSYLVGRLEGVSVCLIGGLRPLPAAEEPLLAELLADSSATVIRPKPLGLAGVTSLIRDRLGTEAEPGFCAACHRATGGNPLLLQELLRTLEAEEVAPTAAAIDHIERVAPDSVARSVSWRLTQLPAGSVAVARALAVLGDRAADRSVAALSGIELRALPAAAAALARAELVQPTQPLRFVHPLVRNAVYALIPADQRAEEHARAAALLRSSAAPFEALAAQLLLAPPGSVDGSVDVLREAARNASREGVPESAARYLARALEEPLDDEQRSETLLDLAAVDFSLGLPSAIAQLNEALVLADHPDLRSRALFALGHALSLSRRDEDLVAAAQIFEDALAQGGGADDDLGRRLEAELLGTALRVPSLHQRARQRLAALTVEASEGPGARMLLGVCAWANATNGTDRERALDFARDAISGMPEDAGVIDTGYTIEVLLEADQLEEGLRVIDTAVADARRGGAVLAFSGGMAFRGLYGLARGTLIEAEADARIAVEALPHGDVLFMPHAYARLAQILVERGAVDEATAVLADAEAAIGAIPERFSHVPLLRARGVVASVRGDHRQALNEALAVGRVLDSIGFRNPVSGFPGWRSMAALAHRALGATEEARRLADEEVALAEAWGAPRGLGRALRIRGLIEGGADGIDTLARSVTVLEGSPARLEYAYALADLGGALRRSNRRAAARDGLRQALELAQRCGAQLLAERTRAELVATGARPRRPMLTGIDALTPSERRIAGMAAEGRTNPEIAQDLFVTLRTVEMHMRNSFRKLGISSRTQLPGAFAATKT